MQQSSQEGGLESNLPGLAEDANSPPMWLVSNPKGERGMEDLDFEPNLWSSSVLYGPCRKPAYARKISHSGLLILFLWFFPHLLLSFGGFKCDFMSFPTPVLAFAFSFCSNSCLVLFLPLHASMIHTIYRMF